MAVSAVQGNLPERRWQFYPISTPLAGLDHTLTISLPPESLYVDGDAGRLSQVVGNLLANAAKFTDKRGQIWLSASREGDEAVIRVRDNGIGIAPEHLATLFDMFVQVDTTIERSRDGLGIGLTLVKKLVELHGGTVHVHSAGPGCGSEFTVRLAAVADAEPKETGARAPSAVDSIARRVLVVDDSPDAAESLAMLLEFEGHEVDTARSAADALDCLRRREYDLVITDYMLPDLTGTGLLRRARQAGLLDGTRVLLATARVWIEKDAFAGQFGMAWVHLLPIGLAAAMLWAEEHPNWRRRRAPVAAA